jgi:transposase-like protein
VSIPVEPTDRDYFAHVFTAEEGRCRACGRDQQITQWRGRHIERADGYHLLIMRDRRCPDLACPGRTEIRRAPDEHRFALKKDIYGLDIVFEIADRRLSDDLSFEEIQRRLAAKGVKICLKTVGNAFKRFSALMSARSAESEESKAQLRKQGGMIVLVDGVQYDDHSPVLYVAIDSISRTVLFAERHLVRSTEGLKPLLERLKAMDVQIKAFVTDKEKGLVPAIRAVFPDVPHQFCQLHFLKRCAAPLDKSLARLGEEVDRSAEKLRKIRRTLADAADTTSHVEEREREVAEKILVAAHAASKRSGRAPIKPTALERHEGLLAVAEQADEAERLMRLQGGAHGCQGSRRH